MPAMTSFSKAESGQGEEEEREGRRRGRERRGRGRRGRGKEREEEDEEREGKEREREGEGGGGRERGEDINVIVQCGVCDEQVKVSPDMRYFWARTGSLLRAVLAARLMALDSASCVVLQDSVAFSVTSLHTRVGEYDLFGHIQYPTCFSTPPLWS